MGHHGLSYVIFGLFLLSVGSLLCLASPRRGWGQRVEEERPCVVLWKNVRDPTASGAGSGVQGGAPSLARGRSCCEEHSDSPWGKT
jgi:hypothetical protein